MHQLPLTIGVDVADAFTFDSFEPSGNEAALAQLRSMSTPRAPVFLWGPAGSGKSHLLKALARRWALQGGTVAPFEATDVLPWQVAPATTLITLDDCDRLDDARQHDAFALFIHAAAHGVQVVGTARVPPIDLPVRDDLRTRLGWGLVYAVTPLPESVARQTLRREAQRRGIALSDEVMSYWLTHFARDLKSQVRMLDRLDVYALTLKRPVTVPLIRQMILDDAQGAPAA